MNSFWGYTTVFDCMYFIHIYVSKIHYHAIECKASETERVSIAISADVSSSMQRWRQEHTHLTQQALASSRGDRYRYQRSAVGTYVWFSRSFLLLCDVTKEA